MDADKPMAAVKKTFRPDWIDSENKIFINELNFICENFRKNQEDVSFILPLTFHLLAQKCEKDH
jgi:hypothetical protein